MKKIFVLALCALLSSSLYAIEAKVISVSGKVQIQKGTAWVDLKAGDIIKKGEMIQTGFKSEAQISLTSGNQNSRLTVAPLSRLTIEQLAENSGADKTSVYLSTGSVKSEIKKTEDRRASYTVRSPVATASVRGTIITVSNGFDSTSLNTEEGKASFYSTPASSKKPVISTAEEDSAFTALSSEQLTDADIYPKTFGVTSSVSKGQSASLDTKELKTAYDNAVSQAERIDSTAVTASQLEVVNTYSRDIYENKTDPAVTGYLKVRVQYKK